MSSLAYACLPPLSMQVVCVCVRVVARLSVLVYAHVWERAGVVLLVLRSLA